MALVTKPNPLPSGLNYVPPNSEEHRVRNGESWEVLAELPGPKAARMSPNDLCYFNFRTRVPREINWYLYNKVGCRHATPNGNYMFSAADQPGLVYLPTEGKRPPVNECPPKPPEEPRLNMWVGIGGKAGTTFVVAGIETLEGAVVSLDSPHKWMGIHASVNRLGLGWGATGGACIIVITGVSAPHQLHGFQQGDWDFNLALGAKWDKVARAANSANKFRPLINAVMRIGAKTPKGLKALLKADPDRYVDLAKAAKSVRDALGVAEGQPNVFMVDVPWAGGGVEASVFFGVANFEALWDTD
jgi:hypothetical protein